jgi:hypothetical protein
MGRKVIAILLLFVLTIESVGLTVVLHLCSSGHTAEINAVNGILSEPDQEGCCCSDRCSDDELILQEQIAFQPAPCCTDIARYIKLDSDFYLPYTFSLFPIISLQPAVQFSLTKAQSEDSHCNFGKNNREPSPPLLPYRFLISIHQLKIAGHCC